MSEGTWLDPQQIPQLHPDYADKPRVIPFLAEGIQRTVAEIHPRHRRTLRIVMARRDAAGLRELSRRLDDPEEDGDWRNWPATGHRFLGFPVELDDTVDRPEVRFAVDTSPALPSIPAPEPHRTATWRLRKWLAGMLEPKS